ncbi:MIF4G domain-containing protein A isoform X2 [Erpetoichthys calabaricus]|uniref:MIF4G domain-containing protein A isoform X2 n=1 Tax=Erpetoichthys calabaricus TaxID=27687 RepID=UPI0022340C75|nr:MIF4G domain-containing protein A isoform X2 [Erpetoichthys calabaricus]
MDNTTKEEYKIQSFDAKTQQLLKTALKDPSSVDLEKVANLIVDQSLKDQVFSKEAGRICYTIVQVNNMPMMALVSPVYDCLFRLSQPDSLHNEEEVDCLVMQLHRIGDQLEKMNVQRMDELFFLLRDGFFLHNELSSLARLLLLEILEFRASGWRLSDSAQKYYYSEVTD